MIRAYNYETMVKVTSYGLVHYLTIWEDLLCGDRSQYGPPLREYDEAEPVSCLRCLVLGDPR